MTRIAIVTGGNQGIGQAIARQLTADGCRVAVIDLKPPTVAEPETAFFAADVSDFAQTADAVSRIEAALGPVDILVNNAGITRDTTLHKMTPEQWDSVLRVDLYGVFNMSRQVIGGMRERGFGRIVSISSVNAQKGQFGQTNYCAAKAGIIGFTKALALESARKGVTVNAVAPGYTDTSMVAAVPADVLEAVKASIPVGRLGRPEEIARCVAFLASDNAGFITGSTVAINGGQYAVG
jgi:acetoacetyl-CoA reductase